MGHHYRDESQVELDASPDSVWEAIATGPGMDAWFMGRTEVDEGPGGTVRADMGGFSQDFTITVWEPRHRLAYRTPPTDNGSFLALEWLIEGRTGTTVLRSVGSGFIGNDDWQDEYDALRSGGARYLHDLQQYLMHFAGRTATPINAACPRAGDVARMWNALLGGLELDGMPTEGDAVHLRPAGHPPIVGVADYITPNCLGVRDPDGLYRFFPGMSGLVLAAHHLFSPVDEPAVQHFWQNWLVRQLT